VLIPVGLFFVLNGFVFAPYLFGLQLDIAGIWCAGSSCSAPFELWRFGFVLGQGGGNGESLEISLKHAFSCALWSP